ncbi:MAG: APC family permease [Gammaproteobacteria bacterium]
MHQAQSPIRQPIIGLFTLTMLSVSAIIALRNLPMMALHGFSSLFFYAFAALLFFIPVSLACAELASGWPKEGGVYAWVKEAFGEKAGALAIWFEWIESVVWLPTVLSFIAATSAYLINPALAQNRYFLLAVMLTVLWSGTFINFLGMKTSSLVSSLGIMFGSLIPGTLIVMLAIAWLVAGNLPAIGLTTQDLIPSMNLETLVFFTGILLSFAGMEVSAFHVRDTKDPQRAYPKAAFLAAGIIITIYALGSLSIALVVPKASISLTAGVMQAFEFFFHALNLPWAVPVLAFLLLIGALALVNTWIIGPSRGLLTSALNNDMPDFAKRTNRIGTPVAILLMQATISTLLAFTFLFLPSVNSSYWLLTVLASQLILIMYFLIFLSVIRLRYTQPNTVRAYQIPGGKIGVWLIAGTGAVASVLTFLIGFVPAGEFEFGGRATYTTILLFGIVLTATPPFFWQWQKHKKTKT